uniref:autotransporter family protein n=1 Tax=Pontiella sp. TaxID=2837462 RepID=UPI003561C93E
TTINGGTFVGADGGTAVSRVGYAEASGGSGAYSTGNLTINGGTFTGGDGGKASADEGTVYSEGGAGAATYGTTLTINGGTFTGGAGGTVNGVKTLGNVGVRVTNGNLAITTNSAATVINGHIVFDNSASKSMSIAGATIGGNIYKYGAGTALITVDDTASYGGAFMQAEGSSQITLTSTNQGRFFSDVTVADGNMTFQGTAQLITSEDAQFTLGPSNTVLTLQQGARFSKGSGIDAGYSSIVSSGGSLTLAEDSAMSLLYDGYYDNKGSVNVSGSSFVMNDNAELSIMGVAAQPTNSLDFVSGGTVTVSTNATVKADLGWLVDEQVNIGASSISVDTVYNSLTNTSLSDLGSGILLYVDSIILSTNVSFYDLNASGESKGDQLFRYTLSQLPDTGEASIQVSQQLHEQIAARGTEFRSMNGFASSKPTFGNSPVGVAGPVNKIDEEKTMQGWVRAYGGKGSRDADGTFAEYDSSSWGTVIGVDKSFGNLLVGLAGGYARTDLDAGSAYQSDIDTYHGSIYSTFGGESCFLDVALTYGWASTEEESTLVSGEFDSQMYSAYIGAGYAFELGEKLALTPEASFLASFYDQEEYTRDSILGNGTVQEYDTSSFLGSIGVNLATQHQIDWLNRGIAYIPEIRAHYIREFNADPDDFTYVLGGTSSSFAVRPRDEDLLRLGFGFDMWNWRYQNTKFEIDYDGLFSEKYYEHMVSGKVTWRF